MPAKLLTGEVLQALITGVPKVCPNAQFTVASKTYTASEAVALFTSVQTAGVASAAKKAEWKVALLAEEAVLASEGEVVREIRRTLGLMYRNDPASLNTLGIPPRKKPKPLSGEARAAATAKAKATREARGTESKKKALIHGDVVGVTIVPTIPSGATATTPATPPAPPVTTPPVLGVTVPGTATATRT